MSQVKDAEHVEAGVAVPGADGQLGGTKAAALASVFARVCAAAAAPLLVVTDAPIKCYMGTREGFLFLLDAGLLFLMKVVHAPRAVRRGAGCLPGSPLPHSPGHVCASYEHRKD